LLLHLAVVVIAPGCAVAGWWQATRALAGNGLSWVYSFEWPVFGLIAIAGWWQLVHEDPEAYCERRRRPSGDELFAMPEVAAGALSGTGAATGTEDRPKALAFEPSVLRHARRLAMFTALEFVVGIVAVVAVPIGRPSGWLPATGKAVYVSHAVLGLVVISGACAFLLRVRRSAHLARVVGWMGFVGLAAAGGGGLLTGSASLVRFLGMALMCVGPMLAAFAYLVPTLLGASPRAPVG
jgi:hypothetical protein